MAPLPSGLPLKFVELVIVQYNQIMALLPHVSQPLDSFTSFLHLLDGTRLERFLRKVIGVIE